MERNPYTRALHPKRINDDEGEWLYYQCSKCRALIDAKRDDKEALQRLFIEHVKSAHPVKKNPREDVNQGAARVVKEATSRW
jgi:hypothetical protein